MNAFRKACCLGGSVVGVVIQTDAAIIIPDGDINGVSDTQTFSSSVTELASVTVTVSLSGIGDGGYNGDLYMTLSYGSGYAVLLNRVGRTADNSFGYSDSGIIATFDDSASGQDVHLYRVVLYGSSTLALSGALTGTWQSDGRATDPDAVLDTDARTATLSSFTGLNPNGNWTLFMADLSSGGQSQLDSWNLDFTPVPEPAWCGLGMGVGALALALARGRWIAGRSTRRKL